MWGFLRALSILSALFIVFSPATASAEPSQDRSERLREEGASGTQSDRLVAIPPLHVPKRVPPVRHEAEKVPAPKSLPGSR